jgi:hypothetical protein
MYCRTCCSATTFLQKSIFSFHTATHNLPTAFSIKMKTPLDVFRFGADHPPVIILSFIVFVISMKKMLSLTEICLENGAAGIPDLLFGFSTQELRELYNIWGEEGCAAYIKANTIDLFPYMEAYTMILGSLLVMGARRMGWNDQIGALAAITMMLDVGETVTLRQGCVQGPPDYLSDSAVFFASVCNQIKWTLFVGICATILLSSFVLPTPKKAKQG